jgi:hypothetical protein
MIKTFCDKLAVKRVGNLLSCKLVEFIEKGYTITISNNDYPLSSTIYPKIRYVNKTSVLIVIPNVPYFTSNYTVEPALFDDIDISNKILGHFKAISECLPSIKIKQSLESEYNFLFQTEPVPPFIHFAHELIHCLRHFEKLDINRDDEEEATIYGLKNNVLTYGTVHALQDSREEAGIKDEPIYITENSIRREWKLNARVNHNSVENFCHEVRSTYPNAKKFSKKDFFN